jgi:hypothetical protein
MKFGNNCCKMSGEGSGFYCPTVHLTLFSVFLFFILYFKNTNPFNESDSNVIISSYFSRFLK